MSGYLQKKNLLSKILQTGLKPPRLKQTMVLRKLKIFLIYKFEETLIILTDFNKNKTKLTSAATKQ